MGELSYEIFFRVSRKQSYCTVPVNKTATEIFPVWIQSGFLKRSFMRVYTCNSVFRLTQAALGAKDGDRHEDWVNQTQDDDWDW